MAKRTVVSIGGVSLALTAVMGLASLSTILLARLMTPQQLGEFSLIRTLVLLLPPIAACGQDVATARFFSRRRPEEYAWHSVLVNILIIAAVLLFIGVAVSTALYHLSPVRSAVLFFASLAYTAALFFSNLWRGRQNYAPAILILNGFRGVFFLFALAMFVTGTASPAAAIYGYLGIIIVLALISAQVTFKRIPQGQTPVPKSFYSGGLLLLGSQTSVTLLGSLDSLFIPKMLDLASLGLYQAASAPAQLFNIIGRAGKYVWVPEFGARSSIRVKNISLKVGLAGGALLLISLLAAKPVLHFLYAGKYDAGAAVLRIMLIAGAVRLYYNLGSSIIIGRLGHDALAYHLVLTVILVFVEMGLLTVLLKAMGVIGAALAGLVVAVLRTLFSYAIVWKFRDQLVKGAS